MAKGKDIESQIRILATNLEILNQKITKNPEELISPGEKAINDKLADLEEKVEYLLNIMKSTEIWHTLRTERELMQAQTAKLEKVLSNLNKVDKVWLAEMFEKMSEMNATTIEVNENMKTVAKDSAKLFDDNRDSMLKNIGRMFRRLKKDFQYMLVVFFVLCLVVFGFGVAIAMLLL